MRVVLATPLSEDICKQIEQGEPDIELIRDHSLLPPMRWPGDHEGDPSWDRTPSQESQFHELVTSGDALYGCPIIPDELAKLVATCPRLRWIQMRIAGGGAVVRSAGLSRFDLERVAFTTAAGVHGAPLSEFAILGLLAGAKNLPRLRRDQLSHCWPQQWFMNQLSGRTVLILGLGGIGMQIAHRLNAFGCHVVGTSRQHTDPPPGVTRLIHPSQLVETVRDVDDLVVTLPETASTFGLVGRTILEAIRPGCTLVNVGRGTVVDEVALVDALHDGRVGFAALDVVAQEPLPRTSPLWDMDNVVISPHTASMDVDEDQRIAELFVDNARRFIAGETLRNRVDLVEFY